MIRRPTVLPGRLVLALALVALAGCVTAAPAVLPKHTGPELLGMTTDQRIDYLSQAYQFAAEAVASHPAIPNTVFDQVILPTYQAILQKDGVFVASALFALTYADDATKKTLFNFYWTPKVKAEALADPGLTQLYASRQFPRFELHPMWTWASLEERLTHALYASAQQSDPRACEWLSTSPKLPDEVIAACATVPNSGQARFRGVVDKAQREQAAVAEAIQRAQANKPADIARAQDVLRRCAAVGVPSPVMDASKVAYLKDRWITSQPERGWLAGQTDPASVEMHIRELTDAQTLRSEAKAVAQGSAVTPFLTPRMFMALAEPQCGLR